MADIVQNTTWKFGIDMTELNEAEKRLRTITEMHKQIERGLGSGGNPNSAMNRATQEARGFDVVTAAVNRQKRAYDDLDSAKRRAARDTGLIHGPMPRVGPVYGPRAFDPRDTGVMYGPMGRPIMPRDTGSHYGPAGGPYDMQAATDIRRAIYHGINRQSDPGHRTQYTNAEFDGLRYAIQNRYRNAPQHLPAGHEWVLNNQFFDDAIGGRSYSRMPDLVGGRARFDGMATYGGMSAATAAMMNRRAVYSRGFRFNSGLNAVSSFGQAAVGLNMAFDSDLDPISRIGGGLWGGMELGAGVQATGRAMGGRAGMMQMGRGAAALFRGGGMAGTLARVAGPAALVYAGLKVAEMYYDGQAEHAARIGGRYDDHFSQRNQWRDEMGRRMESHRWNQARERLDLNRQLGNAAYDRFTGRLQEDYANNAEIDATLTDPVEYTAARRQRRLDLTESMGHLERNTKLRQQELDLTKGPVQRREIRRDIAAGQMRLATMKGLDLNAAMDIADTVRSEMGQRDDASRWIASAKDRLLTHGERQELDRMRELEREAVGNIQAMGVRGNLSLDDFNDRFGRYQRKQMEERNRLQRNAENVFGGLGEEEARAELRERQDQKTDSLIGALDRLTNALIGKGDKTVGLGPMASAGPAGHVHTALNFMDVA